MEVTVKSSNRVLAPEGIHAARCIRIVDLGTQLSNNPDWKPSRKLNLGFELVDEPYVFDEEKGEENFVVYANYTLSLGKKSRLRPVIESWTGKKIEESFELDNLLDAPCQIQIVHTKKDDKTYANITNIMAPGKGKVTKSTNKAVSLYLDETFDQEVFDSLPEFMQDMISDSPEYQALTAPAAPAKAPVKATTKAVPAKPAAAAPAKPAKKK